MGTGVNQFIIFKTSAYLSYGSVQCFIRFNLGSIKPRYRIYEVKVWMVYLKFAVITTPARFVAAHTRLKRGFYLPGDLPLSTR